MPTVFLLSLPLQSYCFCYLYACPLPVPDVMSSSIQSMTSAGGGGPSGNGPVAIIGAAVAVVVVLVVGSVILAASLIAWRVRSKGKKTLTGKQSDEVLHVLAVRCGAHMHYVLFAHTFLSIFY